MLGNVSELDIRLIRVFLAVVEAGGVLSHAAVMARELELPAVIGAAGAMSTITDGDTVEVDPIAGSVRVMQADLQMGSSAS